MARFHADLIPDMGAVCPSTYLDRKIGNIIERAEGCEDFDRALERYEEWDIFFHLTDLRRGVLNWYDFPQDAKVLEIEGEFGAITGMLCEKAAKVTVTESNPYRAICIAKRYEKRDNLDVYAGHIFDLQRFLPYEKFDYIILLGTLQRVGNGDPNPVVYAEYLKRLQTLLSDGGKILLAVENRFGLRYFCGERDSITGRPFDGINHYPFGSGAYTFSRAELEHIVDLAGMKSKKFYYPLPDYRVPQLIYSEDYFEGKEIYERLSTYSRLGDTLVIWERNLYKDILQNGVQDFFANSFLVECSLSSPKSNVSYAVLSMDRGKEGSCTTSIHDLAYVKKEAAFPEGNKRIFECATAIEELRKRKVPVVGCEFQDGVLVMPYIKSPTLSNYMKEVLVGDPAEFIALFDELYTFILMSSEHVESCYNYFNKIRPELVYGEILQTAFLDMVPANCFYDNGKFVFFDQEFTRHNFPAKYVLYRAIKYTYMYIGEANMIVPQEELKAHFELGAIWDVFELEEERFISSNRKVNVNNTYYRGVYLDINGIYTNSEKLEYKGESLTAYSRSERIEQVKKIRLEMLGVVRDLCEKYDITYYAFYGTLLGAVRHKNFIPWDDDLDIAMLREDYEVFIKVAERELDYPYAIQTMYNDPECFYGGYAKLRREDTTAIEKRNWGKTCNQGIWIDIIPVDDAFSEDRKNLKIVKKCRYYQKLLFAKVYGGIPEQRRRIEKSIFNFIACFYSHQMLCYKLDQAIRTCRQKGEVKAVFSQFLGEKTYRCFDQNDFQHVINLDFADMRISAPSNYDHCLRATEGDSYLRLPPLEERKVKHKVFYDCDIPYNKYLNFYSPDLLNMGEELILNGDKSACRRFVECELKGKDVKWREMEKTESHSGDLAEKICIVCSDCLEEISIYLHCLQGAKCYLWIPDTGELFKGDQDEKI